MTTHAVREDREKIPRILLRAIAALLTVIVALVALARITGAPPAAMPPADTPVTAERVVHLFGSMDGNARVLDTNGTLIADLGPSEGGFIAGVWRTLNRQRAQQGIDPAAPVRIVRFSDGRLGIRDDYTGWRAELIGFGRDNAAAFARLLDD